jgi:hypothetical protein
MTVCGLVDCTTWQRRVMHNTFTKWVAGYNLGMGFREISDVRLRIFNAQLVLDMEEPTCELRRYNVN